MFCNADAFMVTATRRVAPTITRTLKATHSDECAVTSAVATPLTAASTKESRAAAALNIAAPPYKTTVFRNIMALPLRRPTRKLIVATCIWFASRVPSYATAAPNMRTILGSTHEP